MSYKDADEAVRYEALIDAGAALMKRGISLRSYCFMKAQETLGWPRDPEQREGVGEKMT